MNVLELINVNKRFGNYQALNNISLGIHAGTIFALLGPNGAGKTTMLRIITNILVADSGQILFSGKEEVAHRIKRIGYMPEERGLYKKMKVGEQLVYLTALKLGDEQLAKKKVKLWLEKLEIDSWWNKQINELSKGMSQKVQFIATVAHDPELIILDEPFSGLDPINSNLIEAEIKELKKNGASILFSTHRMEQVEELCEELCLLNKGELILQGKTAEIKHDFKKQLFNVNIEGEIPPFEDTSFAHLVSRQGNDLLFKLAGNHRPNELLRFLIDKGLEVHAFNEKLPTINEIFIEQVNGKSDE